MIQTQKEMIEEMYETDHDVAIGIKHDTAYNNIMDNMFYGVLDDLDNLNISSAKPKQYQIGIDTFERSKANMTKDEYIACMKFNIDKYCWRKKGQDISDFKKIIAYANEAISVLES